MNLFNPVSKIMTRDLITLAADASIADAAEIFNNHNIHHIPITDGNALKGIVSIHDYLFFRRGFQEGDENAKIEQERMESHRIDSIMTKGLAKLESSDKIVIAVDIFRKNKFHAIPVVDENELVGIVTTHDIIDRLGEDEEVTAEYE